MPNTGGNISGGEAARLFVSVAAEIRDLKAGMKQVRRELQQAKTDAENTSKGITKTEKQQAVERRNIWSNAARQQRYIDQQRVRSSQEAARAQSRAEREMHTERRNLWANAARQQRMADQERVKSARERARAEGQIAAQSARAQSNAQQNIAQGYRDAERAAFRYARYGAAIAATATAGVGLSAVKMFGQIEQAEIAFGTMLRSGKKAMSFLDQLRNFAAQTPFEFVELQDVAKRMLAMGYAADEVLPTLHKLGDATSALGVSDGRLQRIILALSQMRNASRVNAQDMRQLTEAGIPAWDMLAKAIGKSRKEIRDFVTDPNTNGVRGDIGAKLLTNAMGKRYEGMMKRQSTTLLGLWSNFKDRLGFQLTDIGAMIVDKFNLKSKLSNLIKRMQTKEFKNQIMEVATEVANFVESLVDASKWAWKNRDAIVAVTKALLKMYVAVKLLAGMRLAGTALGLIAGGGAGAGAGGAAAAAGSVGLLSKSLRMLGLAGVAVGAAWVGGGLVYDLFIKPGEEADRAREKAKRARDEYQRFGGGINALHRSTGELSGSIAREASANKKLAQARRELAKAEERLAKARGKDRGPARRNAAGKQADVRQAEIDHRASQAQLAQARFQAPNKMVQIDNNLLNLRNSFRKKREDLKKLRDQAKWARFDMEAAYKDLNAGIISEDEFLKRYTDAKGRLDETTTPAFRKRLDQAAASARKDSQMMDKLSRDRNKLWLLMARVGKARPGKAGGVQRADNRNAFIATFGEVRGAERALSKQKQVYAQAVKNYRDALTNYNAVSEQFRQGKASRTELDNAILGMDDAQRAMGDAGAKLDATGRKARELRQRLNMVGQYVPQAEQHIAKINYALGRAGVGRFIGMKQYKDYVKKGLTDAEIVAAQKRDAINARLRKIGDATKGSALGGWIAWFKRSLDGLRAWASKGFKINIKGVLSLVSGGILGDSPGGGGLPKGLAKSMAGPLRLGRSMGLSMSSGYRPGAVTGSGKRSDHATGHAVDMVGSASKMASFYRAAGGLPGLKQRIYSPLDGWSNDHYDHVHVAMYRKGGKIPGSGHSDRHQVMAHGGEFMLRREAAAKIGYDKLNQLNSNPHGHVCGPDCIHNSERKYRQGGLIGSYNKWWKKARKKQPKQKKKRGAYWENQWGKAQGMVDRRYTTDDLRLARAEVSGNRNAEVSAYAQLIKGSEAAFSLYNRFSKYKFVGAGTKSSARSSMANELRNIKNYREQMKGVTSGDGGSDLSDLQDQLKTAQENLRISEGTLAAMSSSGDIGTGTGANALQSATGGSGQAPQIVIQTLHPADPNTLRAISSAATGGYNSSDVASRTYAGKGRVA